MQLCFLNGRTCGIVRATPFLAALTIHLACQGQVISTVAGGGFNLANGVAATAANVGATQGIAVDGSGNIFFWDAVAMGVRKVNPSGIINTVAGNGSLGYYLLGSIGDGGPATSAGFGPTGLFAGVAVDTSGNLYISDPGNKRVRKVDSKGIITTFAGGGASDTPATKQTLGQPTGLAVDSAGNVYVADILFGRIYKVDTSGNIAVVAGGGSGGDGGAATSASIISPYGLAVDSQGNLYIAEASVAAMRVRKVTPGGIINTVAGGTSYGYSGDGGAATSAQLFGIEGIAVDKSGNLYIADSGNDRIRRVDSSTQIISTIAGNGHPGSSGDNGLAANAVIIPGGLALDSAGNLYITASNVRKIALGAAAPGLYSSASSLYFAGQTNHTSTSEQQTLIIGTLGAPISFNVTAAAQSGGSWLSVSGGSGTTPQIFNVNVSVLPATAGTYKGTVTATPTTPGYSPILIPVTLVMTASPPTPPVITDVQNGASFQSGYAPNAVWTVKGTNLASTTDNWNSSIVGGALPTSLDGVTVTFNGYPAYISYISPTQINLITPDAGVAIGSVSVNNNGATGNLFNAQGTGGPAPAFFLWPNNQAVATHLDYTYSVRAGTFSTLATVPAKPGEVIVLWGTGFGPTTQVTQTGAVVPSDKVYSASTIPNITINNIPVTVYGAALAAGYAGLWQVAIQVPASLGNGDWPIVASIGAVFPVQSPTGIVLSVHN